MGRPFSWEVEGPAVDEGVGREQMSCTQ